MTRTNAQNHETTKLEAREASGLATSHYGKADVFADGFIAGRTLPLKLVVALSGKHYGEDAQEEFLVDTAEALLGAGLMIEPFTEDELGRFLDDNHELDRRKQAEIVTELYRLGLIKR